MHIPRLEELFNKFPGIGPRQAKRFVYFLLTSGPSYRAELAKLIAELAQKTAQCRLCLRFYTKNGEKDGLCTICGNETRDRKTILLVEKDVDVESIERSSSFKGLYFVLGGTIPLATEEPDEYVRLRELCARIEKDAAVQGVSEIILGLSATTEGDHTRLITEERLAPLAARFSFKVSVLGRGLSTGSEIEYADPETIKSALSGRH